MMTVELHDEFVAEQADPEKPFLPNQYYTEQINLIQQSRIRTSSWLVRTYVKHPLYRLLVKSLFVVSALMLGLFLPSFISTSFSFELLAGTVLSTTVLVSTVAIIIDFTARKKPTHLAVYKVGVQLRKEAAFQWVWDRYRICIPSDDSTYEALFTKNVTSSLVQTFDGTLVLTKYIVDKGYIICRNGDPEYEVYLPPKFITKTS